jgi:hypothetical protein
MDAKRVGLSLFQELSELPAPAAMFALFFTADAASSLALLLP